MEGIASADSEPLLRASSEESRPFEPAEDVPATKRVVTSSIKEEHIVRALPIAFTAAFSIAATSATAVYAYATLTCRDATHCGEGERGRYASIVATATVVANVCGVMAVPILRPRTERKPKVGLIFWLICRCSGIALLLVGVQSKRLEIALAGKIPEGFATDNILHYALGAMYIRAESPDRVSRLMGTSLALYMTAMSVAPTAMTYLPNFTWSFLVAIGLLGISLIYVALCIPASSTVREMVGDSSSRSRSLWSSRLYLHPVFHFFKSPAQASLGLAIFFYNSVQSYLFPAIMVHAALKFGFSDVENGYIISVAALTSSVYLFVVLFLLPRARKFIQGWKRVTQDTRDDVPAHTDTESHEDRSKSEHRHTTDPYCALVSMATQLITLPLFILVEDRRLLFLLVALLALGLAAPSFIKSYAVTRAVSKDSSLASMAVMESLGGLVSPIVLGAVQSTTRQGTIFLVTPVLVGVSMLCFIYGLFIKDRS